MIGCLIGLFTVPYRFIRWCLENGTKGYISLGIAAVIILASVLMIRGAILNWDSSGGGSSSSVESTGKNLPGSKDAPYKVDTNSRTYYAAQVDRNNETGDVTMTNYWELLGGDTWTKIESTLILDTQSYGTIRVYKR